MSEKLSKIMEVVCKKCESACHDEGGWGKGKNGFDGNLCPSSQIISSILSSPEVVVVEDFDERSLEIAHEDAAYLEVLTGRQASRIKELEAENAALKAEVELLREGLGKLISEAQRPSLPPAGGR